MNLRMNRLSRSLVRKTANRNVRFCTRCQAMSGKEWEESPANGRLRSTPPPSSDGRKFCPSPLCEGEIEMKNIPVIVNLDGYPQGEGWEDESDAPPHDSPSGLEGSGDVPPPEGNWEPEGWSEDGYDRPPSSVGERSGGPYYDINVETYREEDIQLSPCTPLTPLKKYFLGEGGRECIEFLNEVEKRRTLRGGDLQDWVDFMLVHIIGPARKFVLSLPPAMRHDYFELRALLFRQFAEVDALAALEAWNDLTMLPEETPVQLRDRIFKLAVQVFPQVDLTGQDRATAAKMMDVFGPEIRKKMDRVRPPFQSESVLRALVEEELDCEGELGAREGMTPTSEGPPPSPQPILDQMAGDPWVSDSAAKVKAKVVSYLAGKASAGTGGMGVEPPLTEKRLREILAEEREITHRHILMYSGSFLQLNPFYHRRMELYTGNVLRKLREEDWAPPSFKPKSGTSIASQTPVALLPNTTSDSPPLLHWSALARRREMKKPLSEQRCFSCVKIHFPFCYWNCFTCGKIHQPFCEKTSAPRQRPAAREASLRRDVDGEGRENSLPRRPFVCVVLKHPVDANLEEEDESVSGGDPEISSDEWGIGSAFDVVDMDPEALPVSRSPIGPEEALPHIFATPPPQSSSEEGDERPGPSRVVVTTPRVRGSAAPAPRLVRRGRVRNLSRMLEEASPESSSSEIAPVTPPEGPEHPLADLDRLIDEYCSSADSEIAEADQNLGRGFDFEETENLLRELLQWAIMCVAAVAVFASVARGVIENLGIPSNGSTPYQRTDVGPSVLAVLGGMSSVATGGMVNQMGRNTSPFAPYAAGDDPRIFTWMSQLIAFFVGMGIAIVVLCCCPFTTPKIDHKGRRPPSDKPPSRADAGCGPLSSPVRPLRGVHDCCRIQQE